MSEMWIKCNRDLFIDYICKFGCVVKWFIMIYILYEYEIDKGDNVIYYVIYYSELLFGGYDFYWVENVFSLSYFNWYGFIERFVW